MSNEKKFYWLKLKRDFFKRHDIRIVEEMPNGKDYILFYLKMLLESVDHNGALRFSETIPYNVEMLSVITNTNIDVVRAAMQVFQQLNMIEVCDDETIYMCEVEKLIGSETAAAERKRKQRAAENAAKPASLSSNCDIVTPMSQNSHTDKDIDIEKDIYIESDTEIEKEKEKEKKPRSRFIPPTVEEIQSYCLERNNNVDAEQFFDYYTANGWRVGKNAMKDWRATVRNWEKREKEFSSRKPTQPQSDHGDNVFLNMIEGGEV